MFISKKIIYIFLGAIALSLLLFVVSFFGSNSNPQIETIIATTETVSTTTQFQPSQLYKVVKVVDGDTVTISMDGKSQTIRLIGLNTPETVDPRKPVECFGKQASDKAKELLTGKEIRIEKDPGQGDYDKYNRLLVYIFLEDGTSFNKYMIEQGFGYEYTYDLPYKYQKEFKTAQEQAKAQKRGLWADNVCKATQQTQTTTTKTSALTPTPAQQTQSITETKPATSGNYICDRNVYNCSNFSIQSEAQAAFDACGGINNDIHGLDRDKDVVVCESLP